MSLATSKASLELSDAGEAFLMRWMGEDNFGTWMKVLNGSQHVNNTKDFIGWLLALAESSDTGVSIAAECRSVAHEDTEPSGGSEESDAVEVKCEVEEEFHAQPGQTQARMLLDVPDDDGDIQAALDETLQATFTGHPVDANIPQQYLDHASVQTANNENAHSNINFGDNINCPDQLAQNLPALNPSAHPAGNSKQRITCVKCWKTFASSLAKKKHRCSKAAGAPVNLQCVCGVCFLNRIGRANHERFCSVYKQQKGLPSVSSSAGGGGGQQRSYASRRHKCQYCNHSSASSGNLKQHIASFHTTDKRYKCPYCNYATSRNFHLKRHILRHDPNSEAGPVDPAGLSF